MSERTQRAGSFFDWILALFARPGAPGASRRRFLKQAARRLAKSRFRIYRVSTAEILPALPRLVYECYRTVYSAQLVFNTTQNPNAWKSLAINACIRDKARAAADMLTQEAILEQAQAAPLAELEERVSALLNAFLAEFDAGLCAQIDELYTRLMRFRNFCCFDFYALLKKFDANIKEGGFSSTPRFEPLEGGYAAENVKEFAAAALPVVSQGSWAGMFNALKQMHKLENMAVTPGAWSRLVSRLEALKKSNALEFMLQLIANDPYFTLQVDEKQEGVIDSYLEGVKDEVEGALEKVRNEQKSSKIDSLAGQIFGGGAGARLKNYTEDGGRQFTKRNMGGYVYYQPLNYLKAFLLDFVKQDVREFTDLVLVRGKWTDRSYAAPLSNSYHALLDLAAAITELDESLNENTSVGVKLKTMIVRVERDRSAYDAVKKIVKETNNRAKDIIITGTQELISVAKNCKQLLEDYEKAKPGLLTNWKELEHFAQEPIKAFGVEIYRKIHLFVQLMQAYFT